MNSLKKKKIRHPSSDLIAKEENFVFLKLSDRYWSSVMVHVIMFTSNSSSDVHIDLRLPANAVDGNC